MLHERIAAVHRTPVIEPCELRQMRGAKSFWPEPQGLEFAVLIMPVGQRRRALEKGGYQAPGNSAIERWNWNEIERRDKDAVVTQHSKRNVQRIESGVTDVGQPRDCRDGDDCLSGDSAPGDDGVVEPGIWDLEVSTTPEGVKHN